MLKVLVLILGLASVVVLLLVLGIAVLTSAFTSFLTVLNLA